MDKFLWDDEKVLDFVNHCLNKTSLTNGYQDLKEFKEKEQPKKEYEVLSYIDTFDNTNILDATNPYHTFKIDMGKLRKIKIHSVKRLSDSVVFTIGDKVQYALCCKEHPIEWIIDNFLIPHETSHDIMARSKDNEMVELLSTIKKVEDKQPILTTEDGVKIYDRNKCYRVDQNWFIYQGNDYAYILTPDTNKYFSTEQLAKDYVVENKPCLSYSNVVYWLNLPYPSSMIIDDKFKRLKEFVKTKLNG